MDQIFPILGAWVWFVAAGLLMLLELFSPGVFLLWLGIAALLTGIADNLLGLPWQAELLLFAVLAAVSVVAGRRIYRGRPMQPADNPYLNRRQMGYIGRSFTLREPIVDGRGKLTVEDTVWEIEGPDLAAGTRVTVTAVRNMSLIVAPAE
jgi:membrane protein implicated in regulation of membrane protease activity